MVPLPPTFRIALHFAWMPPPNGTFYRQVACDVFSVFMYEEHAHRGLYTLGLERLSQLGSRIRVLVGWNRSL